MAHDRLLFIGRPDADEVAHWSTLRELAPQRGWKPTRTFEPGEVVWAVVPERILDQAGPDTEVLRSLRAEDIPCTSALEAIRQAYSGLQPSH
ncbi:hypothetical protein OED52_06940 [Rhodococcus sp. Z13]|uniref:Uncharacterized protein n=1 Tax=Rhodococcus sacchari TaxID=2962047 RepID=A0ACD4DKN3_9NOCA|nr:hypothetical protein [Rhodococcus sp. Z13]UYP20263.1 hypothetical protein OED52_06940 [Rhodococcus sp. Z13]